MIAIADYGAGNLGDLVATQFHPEKSGEVRLKIYDNFIRIALAVMVSSR